MCLGVPPSDVTTFYREAAVDWMKDYFSFYILHRVLYGVSEEQEASVWAEIDRLATYGDRHTVTFIKGEVVAPILRKNGIDVPADLENHLVAINY